MTDVLYLINTISVGIFGMALAAAFCDICWTRQKRCFMTGGIVLILLFQGSVYLWGDREIVYHLYPVITHFPLVALLCALGGESFWSIISVLTAYLFCQLRRWIALLTVAVCAGGTVMQEGAELALTAPLLLLLLRFAAPSVRSISHYSNAEKCQFGLMPALYYGFDYMTRIYTSLLLEGIPAVVEFMPFVCCLAYLAFVSHASQEERIRIQLEQTQSCLSLQIAQAVQHIEDLRESQRKTNIYRHDLRHHMQYLSSCIENGRLRQAQQYIQEICSEIEANKVTVYCENEAVNLIFSAFAGRAESHGVSFKVRAEIPQIIPVSESDLCVLLSNALENALNACCRRKEKGASCAIDVLAYEKKGKFFLQIVNPCEEEVNFVEGIPAADSPEHGIGARSICAIVERYGGICSFQVRDGQFFLRVSL